MDVPIGRVRRGAAVVGAAVLLVLLSGVAPVAAQLERRFCVTVTSAGPIEGDVLDAVASGEATLTVEAADACLSGDVGSAVGGSDDTGVVMGSPVELLARLPVADERPAGYERQLFRHWVDRDEDGCDTRREVLLDESIDPVRTEGRCRLVGGRWRSLFDARETVDAGSFDVDHVVPLAEAWRSGATDWGRGRRRAFANDLGDPRSLIAVSASSNRSKGSKDPSRWLPPEPGAHCRYVTDWVTVKVRWELTVDAAERDAIDDVLAACPDTAVSVVLR